MKIVKYIGRIYDQQDMRGIIIKDADRKIFAVYEDGHEESIPERQDLVNHSPTGFCWGYGGSGPAQAALAILAHYFGSDKKALRHYHDFKNRIVSRLPMDSDFVVMSGDIEAIVNRSADFEMFHGAGGPSCQDPGFS